MNDSKRPTILIVDDDKYCINMLVSLLSDKYETVIKSSGEEAVLAVNSLPIDLVLLDMYMPGMDGSAVLALISKRCKKNGVPILFITAETNTVTEARMLALGAADYIAKPICSAVVKARIKVHLDLAFHTRELKAAVKALDFLARVDPLTGLGNRRQFYEVFNIERSRAQRYEHQLCIILFDIDNFKIINDTYGHLAGDGVLVEFARKAIEFTRTSDVFARIGGEEFAYLMPQTSLSHAQDTADRFRQKIADTEFDIGDDQSIRVTVSGGVSEVLHDDDDLDCSILRADKALYTAKSNGRNCVVIFDQ
jgi:diguanylate cyclase (GGDEF)-like protein